MRLNFAAMLVAVVVIGLSIGGAFAGGVKVGEGRAESTPAASSLPGTWQEQFQQRQQQLQEQLAQGTPLPEGLDREGFFSFRLGATGVVEKVEGNTITLTGQRGAATVVVEETTAISRSVEGELSDIKEGDQVMVSGQSNDDGTISATSIMVMPPDIQFPGSVAPEEE